MMGNSFVSKIYNEKEDVCEVRGECAFSRGMLAASFAINALIVAYAIISTLIA